MGWGARRKGRKGAACEGDCSGQGMPDQLDGMGWVPFSPVPSLFGWVPERFRRGQRKDTANMNKFMIAAGFFVVALYVHAAVAADGGLVPHVGPAHTAPPATRPAESFKFVSIPDFLNADVDYPQPGWEDALTYILKAIKAEQPDFVLVAGDLVQGRWWTEEKIKQCAARYYPAWVNRMEAHGLKFYAALGDHEIGDLPGPVPKELVPLLKRQFADYLKMPQNGPKENLGTAYSFLYKGTLFVTVDVFDGKAARITEPQLRWFEDVLTRNKDARHVIVMGHTPIIGPVKSSSSSKLMLERGADSPFWKSMVASKVEAYLCGEVHAVTCLLRDDILQIAHGSIIGLTSYANYLVGTVNPDKIVLEIKQITLRNSGGAMKQEGWDKWTAHTEVAVPPDLIRQGFQIMGSAILEKREGRVALVDPTGCFQAGTPPAKGKRSSGP
jgi:hypothetical protein